jgi:di/tricarboxylate transporter
MTVEAVVTVVTLLAMIVGLASRRLSPAAAVLGALGVLFLTGVLSTAEAFSGFSNPAPITIAGLYVIAAAVSRTGALEPIFSRILPDSSSVRAGTARIAASAGLSSAFMANTPIVAMAIPRIRKWATQRQLASSKFLIPLSYAAVLGGTLTVIGTSTNLIVSGLMVDADMEALGFFEVAKIGLPVFLVGIVAIIVLGPIVLPERNVPQPADPDGRPFSVSMVVVPDGPLDGAGVEAAGLRNLNAVYLIEVERAGRPIAPIGPQFVLEASDRLVFAGAVDQIVDLQSMAGLRSAESEHLALVDDGRQILYEAVVGPGSPLAGTNLKDSDFRAVYQAAVVAIHRSGTRIGGKLGQVEIRAGDILLLLAGPDFRNRFRDRRDFLLVSRFDGDPPPVDRKAPWAWLALLIVIAMPALGLASVLWATVLGVGVVVASGALSRSEARDSVDFGVILMIGGALGLGKAVEVSGLSESLTDMIDTLGPTSAIVAVLIVTIVLTEMVTNAAAVALMFPVVIGVAVEANVDIRLAVIALAVAGSASFLSPIGYQTNTMVYGPGGYQFFDYARLGAPLTAIVLATTVLLEPVFW